MRIGEAPAGRVQQVQRLLLASGNLSSAMVAANALLWPATGTAQQFTPFPLPNCGCQRSIGAITAGPDGNLWYVDGGAAVVGRITTSGVVTEFPLSHPVTQLTSIVAGTDGALWFGEALSNNSGVIGQITTAGIISQEITVTSTEGPIDPYVTWGPDGNIWFVNPSDDQPILGTVTPTGKYTPRCFPTISQDGCANVIIAQSGISPGPDGAIWFSGQDALSQRPTLGRITTGGTITQAITDITTTTGQTIPVLVNGPDGALWFTIPGTMSLWRATTGGALSHTEIPDFTFCGNGHASLTVGHDGALWLNGCQLPNAIARVTTGGTVTTYPGSATGSFSAITAGPDGNIWIADNGGAGGVPTIWRFVSRIATHDFNGDGKSDIVWQDTSGNTAVWLMNGTNIASAGSLGQLPGWSIVGQRDFNADGNSDLLWRDGSGDTYLYLMNGTTATSALSIGKVVGWSVGVGTTGLVWRGSALSDYVLWLMSTSQPNMVASEAFLGSLPDWSIVGTGDFNGDGFSDLLWRDNAGDTAVWFMKDTQVLSAGSIGNIPSPWFVAGTGDFDGDGKADIVWSDGSGHTSVWLMSNTSITSTGNFYVPGWSIAQTGDYNGDGKSDLLWRDGSGNTAIWYMSGTSIGTTGLIGNIPNVWTVQSINAE
jgi:streptogramin lyase